MANLSLTLKEHFTQFLYTLHTLPEAIRFFRKNRLWVGFLSYGWVNKILLLVAVIVGGKSLVIVLDAMEKVNTNSPMAMMSSMGTFFGDFLKGQWDFLTDEGLRYGILILLEIFIFHVCHRTVDLLLNDKLPEPRFKDFIKAQVRIAVLGAICMAAEGVVVGIIGPILKAMPGLSWFQEPILFVIHCFFMGVLILDNYNEIFGLKIKESFRYSLHYPGIAIAVGLVLRICFLVPFLGPVVGTLLTAVTVSIVMSELSKLHEQSPSWQEELV